MQQRNVSEQLTSDLVLRSTEDRKDKDPLISRNPTKSVDIDHMGWTILLSLKLSITYLCSFSSSGLLPTGRFVCLFVYLLI